MRKILAIFLAIIMTFSAIPITARAAEKVTLTITTDKTALKQGETVSFTVTLGAVNNIGGLEFNLVIPEGLAIVEDSISVPEGLEDTLDAVMNIIRPSSANQYKWGYFAGRTGYSGTTGLTLLNFFCTVDADTSVEDMSVTAEIETCFDNDTNLLEVEVVPAYITIKETSNSHIHTGIQHHDAVTATCITAGNVDYWTCSGSECAGKYYGDAACQNILSDIKIPVDPNNHVNDGRWASNVEKHSLICACGMTKEEGVHVYDDDTDDYCNVCNYQRTIADSHTHTGIQHHDAITSTCITAGNVDYWTCSDPECAGKYYGDAACQNILSDIKIPIDPNNHVNGGRWVSNIEKHSLICACGTEIEEGAHVYDGDAGKECNVCGYQRIVEEKNENIETGHEGDDDSALPGYGQDASDTAADSVGQVPAADAATAKIPSSGKEPKTADSTPSVATLAMIGGMACLMDLFLNKRRMLGLSETQKNIIIHRIIDKAKAKSRSAKWFALVQVAFILIYYHSIGKRVGEQMDERVQLS